ncbi:MAG: VOC family protein [Gammaproteobacteria bacterium]|nr:VOC family protein [Gammaproteobacteria bacterium]NVK88981.1 VOC family protein [Gammaproteobacteria bacterium]
MQRIHIHINVANLDQSITFYQQLLGAQPTKVKADYAQWLLDEPAVNLAISTRSRELGVSHLGLQAADSVAWQSLTAQTSGLGAGLQESNTTCCYAKSDKIWYQDPQGISWECFYTKAQTQEYGSAIKQPKLCCG